MKFRDLLSIKTHTPIHAMPNPVMEKAELTTIHPSEHIRNQNIGFAPIDGSVERKGHVLGQGDVLAEFALFGQTTQRAQTPAAAFRLYNQSTAVSVPVDLLRDSFAELSTVLFNTETKEIIRDHDVLRRLKKPSPDFPEKLWKKSVATNFLVTGNCYFVMIGALTRPPVELTPISASLSQPIEGSNGEAGQFTITGDTLPGAYVRRRKGNDVLYLNGNDLSLKQIRTFNPHGNSMLSGQSPLVPASNDALSHILGSNHNISLLKNGGTPTLNFHYEQEMDDPEYDALEEKLNKKRAGSDNAGRIIVTTGEGMQIQNLGTNMKDMDFAILQSASRQACALQFHVPLPLITNDAATFSNMESAIDLLFDIGVFPLAGTIYGGMSEAILPRYELDPMIWVLTYDPEEVTILKKRRLEEIKMKKDLQLFTHNELRAELGQDPVEGGEVIYQQASLIALGEDPFSNEEDDEVEPFQMPNFPNLPEPTLEDE